MYGNLKSVLVNLLSVVRGAFWTFHGNEVKLDFRFLDAIVAHYGGFSIFVLFWHRLASYEAVIVGHIECRILYRFSAHWAIYVSLLVVSGTFKTSPGEKPD